MYILVRMLEITNYIVVPEYTYTYIDINNGLYSSPAMNHFSFIMNKGQPFLANCGRPNLHVQSSQIPAAYEMLGISHATVKFGSVVVVAVGRCW